MVVCSKLQNLGLLGVVIRRGSSLLLHFRVCPSDNVVFHSLFWAPLICNLKKQTSFNFTKFKRDETVVISHRAYPTAQWP